MTTSSMVGEGRIDDEDEPITDAKRFIELVQTTKKPFYEGSKMSLLKAIARLTSLKCELNLPTGLLMGLRR